jgi:hypothetical protein
LPDSALKFPLRASLLPGRSSDAGANQLSQDSLFLWQSVRVPDKGSDLSLSATIQGAKVLPTQQNSAPRIFWQTVSLSSLPSYLIPIQNSAQAIRLSWPSDQGINLILNGEDWGSLFDTLSIVDTPSLPTPKFAASPSSKTFRWHAAHSPLGPWVQLDTLNHFYEANTIWPGYYARFANSDVSAPVTRWQSRGLTVHPEDYVPRGAPLQILLSDPQGVDLELRPPRILTRDLDSATLAQDSGAFPTLARMQFTPKAGVGLDSLTVVAYDVSGNESRATLTYRLGDKLKIQALGAWPNPFADTTVFAYTLTDYCRKVDLRIYSRSGRVVRTLHDKDAVGYREIVWDGRDAQGRRIANGLYFLKATARGSGGTATATFKLFKKRLKNQ